MKQIIVLMPLATLDKSMGKNQDEEKKAVECGSSTSEASKLESWHLCRYRSATKGTLSSQSSPPC